MTVNRTSTSRTQNVAKHKNKIKYNKSDIFFFLSKNLLWVTLSFYWFFPLVFKVLPGHTNEQSLDILFVSLFISIVVGTLIAIKYKLDNSALISNLVLGYGIYTALSYKQELQVFFIILIAIAAILLLFFYWCIFSVEIEHKQKRMKIIIHRIIRCIFGTKIAATYCLGLVLAVAFAMSTYEPEPMTANTEAIAGNDTSVQHTISNNIDELVKLEAEVYKTLVAQQKLNLMQIIANIEANYLGLSHTLTVEALELDEGHKGYYNDNEQKIVINEIYIDSESAFELIDTICHEAYHAYQYSQVDAYNSLDLESQNLLMFRKIKEYKRVFEDGYVNGFVDFDEYYIQETEVAAREYAQEAVFDYYYTINEYLNQS